jgi:hypothetical protein
VSACDELIKWLCGEIRELPFPFTTELVLISSGIKLRAELKSISGMLFIGSEFSLFVFPLVDEFDEDGGVEAAEDNK